MASLQVKASTSDVIVIPTKLNTKRKRETTMETETPASQHQQELKRYCFITTGATAPFPELIAAVLDHECLDLLKKEGFTNLVLQCGTEFKNFESIKPVDALGIDINAFDFKQDLKAYMLQCQAIPGVRKQGLVITHAGAGTIMDAMRYGLSMVVVPNASLLDNHQDELAEELQVQNYGTRATVDDLPKGIRRACQWQAQPWVKPSCELKSVVDETVGYGKEGTIQENQNKYCHFKRLSVLELMKSE